MEIWFLMTCCELCIDSLSIYLSLSLSYTCSSPFFFTGLCEQYEVKGFPTLNLYSNGQFVEKYTGGRMAEDFEAYMQKTELPEQTSEETPESENLDTPKEKVELW